MKTMYVLFLAILLTLAGLGWIYWWATHGDR